MSKCLVDGCNVNEPKSTDEAFDTQKFKFRLMFGFICQTHTQDIRDGVAEIARVCRRADDKQKKDEEERIKKELEDARKRGIDLTKKHNKIIEFRNAENTRRAIMMQKDEGKKKKVTSYHIKEKQ